MAYEVGYGRPPKRTRFKPGQSGNPKGRPRPSVSFEVLLKKSLLRRFTVADKKTGVRRKAFAVEVIFRQVVQQAALGDLKPLTLALRMMNVFPGLFARAEAASEDPKERVRKVHARLVELFGDDLVPESEDDPPPAQ